MPQWKKRFEHSSGPRELTPLQVAIREAGLEPKEGETAAEMHARIEKIQQLPEYIADAREHEERVRREMRGEAVARPVGDESRGRRVIRKSSNQYEGGGRE